MEDQPRHTGAWIGFFGAILAALIVAFGPSLVSSKVGVEPKPTLPPAPLVMTIDAGPFDPFGQSKPTVAPLTIQAGPFVPFAPQVRVEPPKSDVTKSLEEIKQSLAELQRAYPPKSDPPVSMDELTRRIDELAAKTASIGTNAKRP